MPDNDSRIVLTVPPECAGMRLDQCVTRLAGDFSRVQIQKIIASGGLRRERGPDRVRSADGFPDGTCGGGTDPAGYSV